MNIFVNLCLIIAGLLSFYFIALVSKEPPRGGDAAAFYPLALVLLSLGFLVCIVAAAIGIWTAGGFEWVSPNKGTRALLVWGGLFAAVVTMALSGLFKYEPGSVPQLLRFFSKFAPALIPLVLVACGLILVNPLLRAAVPVDVYKYPLGVVVGLGVLGTGAGLYAWISQANANAAERVEAQISNEALHIQEDLDYIDTVDLKKDFVQLLHYSDGNREENVREKAIAKIKTHPAWQEQIVYWLENKGAIEGFTFLASNEVDDKNLFPQPVNTGIQSIAEWVSRSIRETVYENDYYPSRFTWEVERTLRTVEKFEGLGVDFVPAIRELRAAFDEPNKLQNGKFDCTATLDRWLKKHG